MGRTGINTGKERASGVVHCAAISSLAKHELVKHVLVKHVLVVKARTLQAKPLNQFDSHFPLT